MVGEYFLAGQRSTCSTCKLCTCRIVGALPRCNRRGPGLAGVLLFLGGDVAPRASRRSRLLLEVPQHTVEHLVGGDRQHHDHDYQRRAKDTQGPRIDPGEADIEAPARPGYRGHSGHSLLLSFGEPPAIPPGSLRTAARVARTGHRSTGEAQEVCRTVGAPPGRTGGHRIQRGRGGVSIHTSHGGLFWSATGWRTAHLRRSAAYRFRLLDQVPWDPRRRRRHRRALPASSRSAGATSRATSHP
jgi:hypothetical protein